MNDYIVYAKDTKSELTKIYDNIDKYDIVSQMEIFAIIGRSLSATSLASVLTHQPATFTIKGEDFFLVAYYDGNEFTYDLKFPFKKVKALPNWEINLKEYLLGAEFSLQIGNQIHKTDYVAGTIGDEVAVLLKSYFPNFYNVVSLGVLLDKYNNNSIEQSAGYVMLFKDNVDIESLVFVFNKIPLVTRMLVTYDTEEKIIDYLTTRIDEEIINKNIKYK